MNPFGRNSFNKSCNYLRFNGVDRRFDQYSQMKDSFIAIVSPIAPLNYSKKKKKEKNYSFVVQRSCVESFHFSLEKYSLLLDSILLRGKKGGE